MEQIKDRIVSLSKPYIRPIVRGKEAKPVEFGCKVNKLQVNGLSFIEHLSYDAFNKGTRLEGSFGNEKNHYLLHKVAARNQSTETCWIFFGMMTANASLMAARKEKALHKAA